MGKDLKDSEALLHVLHRLDRKKCPLDALASDDPALRAVNVIENASALGVPNVVTSYSILGGNDRLNTLFCSCIFNTIHGIKPVRIGEFEPAEMLDFSPGTAEEQQFRLWINSMQIDGAKVGDLFEDVKDGVLLNKVVAHIDARVVDWRMIRTKPKHDLDRNTNHDQMLTSCRALGLKMVGIGASDLTSGDKKAIGTCLTFLNRFYCQ